jgi:hypothetical protein
VATSRWPAARTASAIWRPRPRLLPGIKQPADQVFHPDFTRDGSRKLIEGLDEAVLAGTELISAVTDDLALGILAGLRARGLSVPGDVSVAGFDDIKTLTDIVPQLTTVHVPLDEVAADAIYRATAPKAELRRRTIPTHPIIRESTPPLTGALGLQAAGRPGERMPGVSEPAGAREHDGSPAAARPGPGRSVAGRGRPG